ncbi:MAG: hypothetical protein ABI162_13985 [Luteolibacter sp.]
MRISAALLCAALTISHVHAQALSDADREALLGNLEKLRENVDSRSDARFSLAVAAYHEAMSTDEKALEFYLQCLEKVEYSDMKRKDKDFRDWKKKEEDNLAKPAFRRALRHQLRWLCLTLEAASSKPDQKSLVERAKVIVVDVFNDLKMMADQEKVLTQPATATVFAKAYGIDGMKAEKWPTSPLNLDQLYEQLFLPPLRNPAHLAELRAAWMKRIEQELAIRTNMARYARKLLQEQEKAQEAYQNQNSPNEQNANFNEVKIGTIESMHPPEYQQFLENGVPELLWQMEVDLFKNGDESRAAERMVAHLQKYLDHKSAAQWSDEFAALLKTHKPPAASRP